MLLYAVDTLILAQNEHDVQTVLDSIQEYCTKIKLMVNTNKTKYFQEEKLDGSPRSNTVVI